MALSSIFGALAGFVLLFGAIALSTDNWMAFVSFSSFLMVVGGTTAASYLSYQARYVNLAFKGIADVFRKPKSQREGLNMELMRLVKWGYLMQSKGLKGIEDEMNALKKGDPILKYMLTAVGRWPCG